MASPVVTGKSVINAVMREAAKLTAQERIQKEFGGDARAYRHSLFAQGKGDRQEKPLHKLELPQPHEQLQPPSTDKQQVDEQPQLTDEQIQQILREVDEGLK